MSYINEMTIKFKSLSENEAFARACVASFCLPLSPTIDEITDIKTAVSEAVTNCVVHAYPNCIGEVSINVKLVGSDIYITVSDNGVGIEDINKAKEPFFTTKPNSERSGMGFTVMESFMNGLTIESRLGIGTSVKLYKRVGYKEYAVGG